MIKDENREENFVFDEGPDGAQNEDFQSVPEEAGPDAEEAPVPGELEKITSELYALSERYIRLAAEYDNFRKRTQKEKDSIYSDAFGSAVASFLPILDNLERAAGEQTSDENYKKGIKLILKQYYDILEKLGITEIPALSEKFNPDLHNAVAHTEDDKFPENTVCEVLQKGFAISDRVLRHAIVRVAN